MVTSAVLWSDVLIETTVLAEMILQSEAYANYQLRKKQLLEHGEAQRLIEYFNECKERYEEVQRFGTYHPDYKKVTKEVRQAKRTLDLHEVVASFKEAELELEKWLNEISRILASDVSASIKVPTGHPFFDRGGCGGCSSGGGCRCKASK